MNEENPDVREDSMQEGDRARVAASLRNEFRWRAESEIDAAIQQGVDALHDRADIQTLENWCRQKLEGRVAQAYRMYASHSH